jgi:hypothetical protein
VKLWKVILVTLVIFAAGAITGAVLARKAVAGGGRESLSQTNRWEQGLRPPDRLLRGDFVKRMQAELELSPEQVLEVETIVRESQARTRKLWEEISPQMRAEFKLTQDRLRELLTPEQQQQFEELLKKRRPARHEDRERREPPPGSEPPPASAPPAP